MYTENFIVQASDTGSDGRMKLKCLFDYFQNTAARAAQEFEGTTSDLLSQGYTWVLSKYEADFFDELPRIDERFNISTYHDPSHGYNTLRMFHVKCGEKEIVRAKSSWLLVDVKSGRVLRAVNRLSKIHTDDVIDPIFTEIPEPEGGFECVKEIEVGWHSLDYNGHVNNAVYIEWIYDQLAKNGGIEPEKICISFRSGARMGEIVRLERSEVEGGELFRVRSGDRERRGVEMMMKRRKRRNGDSDSRSRRSGKSCSREAGR